MRYHQIIIAGLACLFSNSVAAQESPSSYDFQKEAMQRPAPATGWSIAIGGGALLSPKYLGDDAYNLAAVPYVRVTNGERFVASVQEGVKYAIINEKRFRAGPRGSVEFGRQEDGDSTFGIVGGGTDDLAGLGDIGTSFTVGGFAELDIADLTVSANLGKAVTGHKGFTGEMAVNYNGRIRRKGPPIIYTFGPRIKFADDRYQNSFFGINPTQSDASGLNEFKASGGMMSYGASMKVIVPLTDKVATTLISSYTRLTGDAARSPLVKERGSKNQGFFGLVTTYNFK